MNSQKSTARKQTTKFKNGQKNLERHLTIQDIQRANKHMNICLASSAIRVMQIKNTVRHHYSFNRMTKIKRYNILIVSSASKDAKQLEVSYFAGGNEICSGK